MITIELESHFYYLPSDLHSIVGRRANRSLLLTERKSIV